MMNRIHGGNITGKGLIDFSININPFGPPPGLKNIIIKNINQIVCYPEADSRRLKRSLGNFHNIQPDNLLVGNGSIELIYLLSNVLRPKKILITIPAFSEYEFAAMSIGAKIVFLKSKEENGFKPDILGIVKHISGGDLVFLCNPNNPTGAYLTRDEILHLSILCKRRKAILAIDEAFIGFVEDEGSLSFILDAVRNKHLLVIRSLTKLFAVPGLRLGYLAAHKDLICKISKFQYPWNVNSLAQLAGGQIIKDEAYINKSKEFILKEKKYLYNHLNKINGLKAYPPSSNFILCRLENGKTAKWLNLNLIKNGIAVRDCGNFRGLNNSFFRVAVKKRGENIKLIKEVKKMVKNKNKKETKLNKEKSDSNAIAYRLKCAKTANGLSHFVMYGDAPKEKTVL